MMVALPVRRTLLRTTTVMAAVFLLLSSCVMANPLPRYDHIVIVIEENQDAAAVTGSPYFALLASEGTSLAHMYGVAHPSQPNYIALFSGSLNGVNDNNLHDISAPNLATALAIKGLTFTSFAEGLPSTGFRGWTSGRYVRRHNPAPSFTNVPDADNVPFSTFPSDYAKLPTVAFVVPNLDNDMHDGMVAAGDAWLRVNLDGYVQWARTHNSLFIVTFDECAPLNPVASTPIATVLVGDGVPAGSFDGQANLYSLLQLFLGTHGLSALGEDGRAPSLAGIWE
jgi:phosphatidylinositol-3-phosphatase